MTAPHSHERQDLLANASIIGSHFHATGGEFLNSDDFFIAEERTTQWGIEDIKNQEGTAQNSEDT